MRNWIRLATCAFVGFALFAASAPTASAQDKLSDKEAVALATEAYVFGYPLVTMEMSRRVMTNVAAEKGTRAPMGHFVRMRQYPDASFRDVTAPNADTLYTSAWLDLTNNAYIFNLPDQGDRYYLMPMLSAWTDVFTVPGKRTTGDKAQTYLITGPKWTGKVPAGMKELKSPTSLVWIIGRTYCTGTPEDYKAVHALQDQYKLTAVGVDGKPAVVPPPLVNPRIDMKTPVRDQVNALGASEYFNLLASLMKDNPPAKEDAPLLAKLAKLGIEPGKEFDLKKLSPEAAKALESVPKVGFEAIMAQYKKAGKDINGWKFTTDTGVYKTDYAQRALIAAIGLGANLPQDAVYPMSETGPDGQKYDGAKKYTVTFAKGQLPPVNGFWSLTMYDAQMFFVANPINRYSVSPRTNLKENADGTVTLYIQNESPGKDLESNWLPAPKGPFVLMFRFYWPKETAPSILNGTWSPPPVRVVEANPAKS